LRILNLKLIYLFFASFLLVDSFKLFFPKIKAESLEGLPYKSIIYLKDLKFTKNFQRTNSRNFEKYLNNDFKKFGNNLIDLISLRKDSEKQNFSIEIESDTQYEKDNIYYAEGNVVVYFSNATMRGDKIIYNKSEKTLNVLGKITFFKGNQYFEASKVFYDLKNNKGYIDNIYGILDTRSSSVDFEIKNIKKKDERVRPNQLSNLTYIDDVSFGLVNDFEEKKKFNITKFTIDLPEIKKWRYKSKRIILEDDVLKSNKIFFTNDALNKPQFILKSKNFTGEVIDQKIKIVSNNSWIILDDLVTLPLGKRTIYDKDSLATWGIGADFEEKDGFYITRNFKEESSNKNFEIKMRPYFLIQRVLKGKTEAFREKNASLLSDKIENDILISDYFGLDAQLKADINKWNLDWENKFISLNPDRFREAFRSKLSLYRSIDLNKERNPNNKPNSYEKENLNYQSQGFVDIPSDNNLKFKTKKNSNRVDLSKNQLDLKFTSSYREKISRGFSGDSEIYFGNSFSIANKKSWDNRKRFNELSFISDIGRFKAKSKTENNFQDLYRSVFATNYFSTYRLWKKDSIDKNINNKYRYTNIVIGEGINWDTNIVAAVFLYSDESKQENLSFTSGPKITLGSFKNNFFDYTFLDLSGNYVLKTGESPFEFDDVDDTLKVNFRLKQQIFGPLVFSYSRSYDFDNEIYSKPIYEVEISRRAYKIGAFYNHDNESLGFNFNIFSFDYSGINSKF